MPINSLPSEPALRVPNDASNNRLSIVTDFSDIVDPFLSFNDDTALLIDFDFSSTTNRHCRARSSALGVSGILNTGSSLQLNTSRKPMPSTNLASRSHNAIRSPVPSETMNDQPLMSEEANKTRHSNPTAPASRAHATTFSDLLCGPGPAVDTQNFMTALPTLTDHRNTTNMDITSDLHASKKRKRDSTISSNFGSFRLRNISHSLETVTSRLHFRKPSTSSRIASSATTRRASSRANHDNISSPSTLIGSSCPPPITPAHDVTTVPLPIDLSNLSAREIDYISSHPLHELPQPVLVSMVQALQTQIEGLGQENEKMKEEMKGMREDWYRTSEELDLERYKVWVKEGEVEALKRTVEGNERVESMRIQASGTRDVMGGPLGVADDTEDEQGVRNELRDSGLSGMTSGTASGTGTVIKRASLHGSGGRNKWMNRKSGVSEWETVVDEMDVDRY